MSRYGVNLKFSFVQIGHRCNEAMRLDPREIQNWKVRVMEISQRCRGSINSRFEIE
ncbi:hypothetical protein AALP_AA2G127200 [Arabis alpina]|uniref:Uncharacterized protein n=1 Tax=Arabis alpina TaxID=50452 RepID=A0A087HH07_ARAAL|nr:hypothetical protein AALP_AA2G127200 [Arabis alpina]